MSDMEPKGLRHDTADLFQLRLLATWPWAMTPCIVRVAGEWKLIRRPDLLLRLADETEVLCPWPGKARQDVFRFTVGEFRKAHASAQSRGAQAESAAGAGNHAP
jgi:hypothetical protein